LRTIQKTQCWWQGFLNGKGPPEDLFTVERLAGVSVDFVFKAERDAGRLEHWPGQNFFELD
jgi:hypothetical protein